MVIFKRSFLEMEITRHQFGPLPRDPDVYDYVLAEWVSRGRLMVKSKKVLMRMETTAKHKPASA